MNTIRILYSDYSFPNEKTIVSLNFDNIFKTLQKYVNLQILCLIYRPEKLVSSLPNYSNITIRDIHNYHNALDLIKKEKPDIIFEGGNPTAFVSNALCVAGRHLKIPVVNVIGIPFRRIRNVKEIGNTLSRFFDDSVPTDLNKTKQKFMKRGRFFIYRMNFLLKTLKETGSSRLDILKTIIFIFKIFVSKKISLYHPRYACDFHFLQGEKSIRQLIELGFKKETFILTGSPAYDNAFKHLKNFKRTNVEKKLQILFAPDTLYEHGIWNKNQQESLVKEIVRNISKYKNRFSLNVKIHPAMANYFQYKSIIEPIDSSISIYQKEDFLGLLEKSDVVISFSSLSSSMIYSLIARKPIIICNNTPLRDDLFLEKKLAYKCTDPTKIVNAIDEVIKSKPYSENDRQQFIKEYLFSDDGCASERICDLILKIVKKKA